MHKEVRILTEEGGQEVGKSEKTPKAPKASKKSTKPTKGKYNINRTVKLNPNHPSMKAVLDRQKKLDNIMKEMED